MRIVRSVISLRYIKREKRTAGFLIAAIPRSLQELFEVTVDMKEKIVR